MLITVSEPAPLASFLVENPGGEAPLAVRFSDTSTLNITSWAWDFGDGTTSSLQNPSHTFDTGSWTVSLTVTSDGGTHTETVVDAVVAVEPLPVALFGIDQAVGDPPLSVTFSDASTLNITSWLWDFGDGTTSTAQNPSHGYDVVGAYDVSLTVSSSAGTDTTTMVAAVTVTEPAPAASWTTSVSGGPAPLDVTFADTSTLNITSWLWDFGDGATSSLQNPSHTFLDPGTYPVSLTVTSAGGSNTLSSDFVVDEPAPIASFTLDVMGGEAPLDVQFSDASTLNITGWSWDFGDGNSSTEESPLHTYVGGGTFTVMLTVTSEGGTDSFTLAEAIMVVEPPPVAIFSATPQTGHLPLTVSFEDSSTLNITSWVWDFGDGSTSTLQHPTHTYTEVGSYDVSLLVESWSGAALSLRRNFVVVEEAPPTADFTLDVPQGPAPLTVNFTDTTSGVVSAWSWDFGDGTTSSQQSPSHVYPEVGTYTVTLTATGIGGIDTLAQEGLVIVDEPAPLADFSVSETVGLPPLAVDFSDLSTLNITSWAWNFGDGNVSTLQNPQHVYDTVGTFEVSLSVTSAGGTATETRAGLITVNEPTPVAAFSTSTTAGDMPLAVDFTDDSTLNITSWSWNFGDGTTSTVQSPSHTYTVVGTYTVTLEVASAGGMDTLVLLDGIVVEEPPPSPAFTADVTTGPAPLEVSFTDATTGMVSMWSWNFGDGASSTLQHPTHTFAEVGVYTVTLTATGIGGTEVLEMAELVTVVEPAPVASFSVDQTSGEAPFAVAFTDSSTLNITAWAWDFGDGNTSTQQSPTHVFQPGTYTVALTVTSDGGVATETQVELITVTEPAPAAAFSMETTRGPAPLAVQFSDESTLNITAWSWNFGDGGSSSLQDPLHTFTDPGTYAVELTVTSAGGTDTLTLADAVVVLNPAPIPGFSADVTSGPAPLAVAFTDATTGDVTSWSWSFGDGSVSTAQSPTHVYEAVGTYTVTLSSAGPGGSNELVMADHITVIEPAPTASFTTSTQAGDIPLPVTFSDTSLLNVTSWSWSFGDGNVSTAQNPTHVYETPGVFTVELTVTSAGGTDTVTLVDHITTSEPAPVASFTSDLSGGDAPLTVAFTDDSTLNITAWAWSFGDGNTSTLQSPVHSYTGVGTYTVELTVTSAGGTDTTALTDAVVVSEPAPTAAFSSDVTSGDAPLAVVFTDESALNITAWAWDFGDGNTSTVQHPTHVFTNVGTYTVALTVTSAGGTDTATLADLILVEEPAPVASFSALPESGVAPLAVAFTDTSTLNITGWSWDFGDGNLSTLQDPIHTYGEVGVYTVTLTVQSPGGSDTTVATDLVTVGDPPPAASFTALPAFGSAPLSDVFTDTSSNVVTSWLWDFGDGFSSTQESPTHVYDNGGTFTVALTVTGPGGTDTLTMADLVVVLIDPPISNFDAAPARGFAPLTTLFTDTSQGLVTSWSWDFGDGGSSTEQNPTYVYEEIGTYTVALTASNGGGEHTERKIDLIQVSQPPAFGDGSFEGQTPGTQPRSPWRVGLGTGIGVNPTTVASDQSMPTHGEKWLEIGADGSVGAVPPTNPGGEGTAPVGAAQVRQNFTFTPGMPWIGFNAAFVLNGPIAAPDVNDFMSIDVSDGVTTFNLYYADSFTPMPLVSDKFGLPMTETATVRTNLAELFPTADSSTILNLTISVGNGGDGSDPSRGYVDSFILGMPATAVDRNGTGLNSMCYSAIAPVVGEEWLGSIDSSSHTSPGWVLILCYEGAATGPVLSSGEILVDLASAPIFTLVAPSNGVLDELSNQVPNILSLVGFQVSTQGMVYGSSMLELCNAVDLTVGF